VREETFDELESLEDIETLEKGLVLAAMDALREIGGEELVQVLLWQADRLDFADADTLSARVPVDQFLQYRDTVIDFLQSSFCATAFQTGQHLLRSLRNDKVEHVKKLIGQFKYSANKLPVIGQAAVLAAKGNPGVVRASMRSSDLLIVTIEDCPECRFLQADGPFCYLNQGVITEFAERYLDLQVRTEETRCAAMGDAACEIEVSIVSA
jgi:predicted ArsR family transcriptional regulator